jgi:glycogen operon protein
VSLFSSAGTAAFLCLFEGDKETKRIPVAKNRNCFEATVPGIKAGNAYGFRVDGPWAPEQGHFYDTSKLLVDPFATRLSKPFAYDPSLSLYGVDTAALVPKGIVEAPQSELPLRKVQRPDFIYELGVKSFTKLHPDVPLEKRGTIAALAEPAIIAHLKSLGVDTIELMPIHAWIDERHLARLGLHNAWGYNAIQFMAPDPRLCPGGWAELRAAVATLHAHNIQVIIDVVYNHSGESDIFGPILSFRGLDNNTYYAQTDGILHNDAGCGNVLALNTPEVTQMVLQSLRHMALQCGVDGFRFDLATVLGRTENGFEPDAPLIQAITSDPVLGSRILIAEPWDVGPGGYRLGNFPATWLEWNDQYRDGSRRFWRGEPNSVNQMATRLCGSSDIFATRKPSASVNFIAAHDGFTLKDLVTYAAKHNEANGEENRDGNSSEVTWPGGDASALLATLFISRGTVMLTGGDEFGRIQDGNNNAYAQDNELTWLNWEKADLKLQAFVTNLAKLRHELAPWLPDEFVKADESSWFGADGKPLDWENPQLRFLGLLLTRDNNRLAIVLNSADEAVPFPLRAKKRLSWIRRFCSSDEPGCAATSACVFEERKT